MMDDDEIRYRARAMERPEDRATREQIERAEAAAMRKALDPRGATGDASAAALQTTKDDAVRDLLDAMAHPDGRCVAKAWDRVTMLYGRTGDVMLRSAFEQYLDELSGKK